MVRHPQPLGLPRLRGTEVEAAISLKGVGAHDLPAQALGEGEAEGTLAGRCGADDGEDGAGHGERVYSGVGEPSPWRPRGLDPQRPATLEMDHDLPEAIGAEERNPPM